MSTTDGGSAGHEDDVERVYAEMADHLDDLDLGDVRDPHDSHDSHDGADLDAEGLPRLPDRFLPTTRVTPMVESAPGLARLAAGAALHTTAWGARATARTWLRVGRAVTDRGEAMALVDDASRALGVVGDLARALSSGTPVARALVEAGESLGGLVERVDPRTDPRSDHRSDHRTDHRERHRGHRGEVVDGHLVDQRPTSLRERGAELLERSRDVWRDDEHHPAYDRMLDEMAPDEARVLVLLIENGPQPSVDVRTGGPIGLVNSQLIAPGITMIGARAGVRHLDQVPSYLNNLFRLGLVWFSREPLRDPMDYQVLEAQPDVLEAVHSVKFARVVRRSIHLTPFGADFVRTCLVEEEAAEADFPEHQTPPEDPAAP